MERAERAYDLNLVAELKHGNCLPWKLTGSLKTPIKARMRFLKEEVTEEIADIVARWTGVPVTKLIEGKKNP